MLFMIYAEDHPGSLDRRLAARPQHLARLETLATEGRLVLAGPLPAANGEGFTGSLIVADFEHLEAAEVFAETDPYLAAEVYARVTVKPFKQVFPHE